MAAGLGGRGTAAAAAAVRVIWSVPAIRDIEAHVSYIGQFNLVAAREVAAALFSAGDSLAAMPHRGRRGRTSGTRELVAASPYVIVYEIGVDRIEILRVWHGRQLA